MKPFEQCPICGGSLQSKPVEKLLREGCDVVLMNVSAEVCLHCGERLYAEEVVKSFETIRSKLRNRELSRFRIMGQSFALEDSWSDQTLQPMV